MPNTLPTPLLRLAFRPFFLFGPLFGLIAIALWTLNLQGWLNITPYGGSLFWHAHEMIFGFVCAIITGFLLTAIQNWSGLPAIKGWPLGTLVGVWLSARILAFTTATGMLFAFIDLLFLPMVAIALGGPIIKAKLKRNLFFIPVLLVLALANALMHASIIYEKPELFSQGANLAVWLIVFIMSVLGGRVIPFFTANGTKTQKNEPIVVIEILALGSTLFLAICYGLGLQNNINADLLSSVYCVAAVSHFIRFCRWKFWLTTSIPLLWSLHLAYLFIPVGMIFGALASQWLIIPSTALHFFTAGAMGSLILSMMSRVALGHSGRPLQPHPLMSIAYTAILLGGLIRTLGVILFPELYNSLLAASGICWVLAFGLFVGLYTPLLSQPRIDGRPG